jgi:hypothetical protein
MSDLVKNPDGTYSKISRFTGFVIFENYTEEDVINDYVEQAKYHAETDMKHARQVMNG